MGKMVVVYTSETGFTKTYANWIAGELNVECVELSDYVINKNDIVIYGGWIYGGTIVDLYKVADKVKELIVFAVGSLPYNEEVVEDIIYKNNLDDIPFFYMESGIRFERLNSLKQMALEFERVNAEIKADEDKTIIDEYVSDLVCDSFDNSDKQYIYALVDYVKEKYGCNTK